MSKTDQQEKVQETVLESIPEVVKAESAFAALQEEHEAAKVTHKVATEALTAIRQRKAAAWDALQVAWEKQRDIRAKETEARAKERETKKAEAEKAAAEKTETDEVDVASLVAAASE
jgi:hypothetical protein